MLRNKVHSIVIFVYLILVTYGIGFIGWNILVPRFSTYYAMMVGLVFFVYEIIANGVKKVRYEWFIIYLAIMPLVSCFSKQLLLGESAFSVPTPILISLTFMSYFALKYFKVEERDIVKSVVLFGLVTAVIQIYQQFFPNNVLFDAFQNDYYHVSLIEVRNNLNRYLVGTSSVQLFCLFFFWESLCRKFTIKNVALVVVFLVSVYLYLTRQIMVAAGLTIIVSSFFSNDKKVKKFSFFLTMCFVGMLVLNWDEIIGGFISMTLHNTYGTDIRQKCMEFFLQTTFSNPIGAVLGFGESHYEEIWYRNGFFASDIGFIGDMFHYGITWVIVYFVTVYKLVVKYKKVVPLYIRLYLIATLISSPFSFPYHNLEMSVVWLLVLFIAGKYVSAYKNSLPPVDLSSERE